MGLRVSSNKNVEMMCKINLVVLEGGRFDDMFLGLFVCWPFFVCLWQRWENGTHVGGGGCLSSLFSLF